MRSINRFSRYIILLLAAVSGVVGLHAAPVGKDKFVVVLDAGHGGKDFGAHDNNAREKDINLAVALKVGELCKKKLKNTEVVFTRDDDTFVSLQGRADIANKAKGDLFVSIHTNSVDAKNKNRRSVAGASVYTQGSHKDEANQEVARRENSVIEFESDFEQKYSGFDPSKDESYIIFEMAQKKNLVESNYFAKSVQDNLVGIAGRKDRGVHQAGFWVLWSTSMPAVLVELDFICNPESAKFMTSKEGVDKLAEAIFEAIKGSETKWLANQQNIKNASYAALKNRDAKGEATVQTAKTESKSEDYMPTTVKDKRNQAKAGKKKAVKNKKTKKGAKAEAEQKVDPKTDVEKEAESIDGVFAMAYSPEKEVKDLSHANLSATRDQKRPRTTTDGRRRRSAQARSISAGRDVAVNNIVVREEITGIVADKKPEQMTAAVEIQSVPEPEVIAEEVRTDVKDKKTDVNPPSKSDAKSKREWIAKVNSKARNIKSESISGSTQKSREYAKSSDNGHAGKRKSLKSKD